MARPAACSVCVCAAATGVISTRGISIGDCLSEPPLERRCVAGGGGVVGVCVEDDDATDEQELLL